MTPLRLLTAREAAAIYGRTLTTIHVTAHRKHWRRIRLAGRVYYDLDDVDRDLGQHA